MESDEDFIAPSQFARTQYRGSSNLSQMVTSSSNRPHTSRGPSQPSQARSQASSQNELSQIQDGLKFLMERVQQLSGDSRGIKRPAEAKPLDRQPNIKQECQICHKLYANKTTLFRHYRGIHQEMNPEKYHGCSVNSAVVSLDASFTEIHCSICGYIASTQNALDSHNRTTHSNEVNANSNRAAEPACNNDNVNKENVNVNIKDKMHKCEDCACYFEERSKFDEHMKAQHGFEVVCKICNKHFFFKDIDEHVKNSHPDVYNKKRKENNERVIVEKVMKNRKGKRVRVFICTKCDMKMYDTIEAEKHARGHKKGLKIKAAPRNKFFYSEENKTVASNDDNVILTCVDCDISTSSYDVAVEHSQAHITNAKATQFVTQLCEICDLKFEPLCYKKHIDLHYKNKEIHRESFKYFKYKFELLPSEHWFKCFDMADPVVKKIIDKSIYEHTRLVKMRVLHEGTYKLYRCCKCDDFVEPTAVLNHTVNYDTCVKVKSSYPCNVCNRTFNNRLAKNNHAKKHKRDDEYKIVLFNHGNDKEINEVLQAYKLENAIERVDAIASNTNDVSKVLYKCLCGLCFVRKETADKHKIICPGKYERTPCPKCNNLFTNEELVPHCFAHHLNETQITVENITPDVVVIDSDEEIIEIDSSDEDDSHNENLNNIKIEVIRTDATTIPDSSEFQVTKENLNRLEAVVTQADVGNKEQMDLVAPVLEIQKTENNDKDEDASTFGQDFEEHNHEMTDDDSQDTMSYENTDINRADMNINEQGELKLVPTNLLLNPFHYESGFFKVADMETINTEINTDIENVRLHIETTTHNPFGEIAIKKEKSWLFDPTDFSNICRRPSLREITMQPSSNNVSVEVEALLTDDEETDNDPGSEETVNNDLREEYKNNSMLNNAPTLNKQTNNVITNEELSNEVLNATDNIIKNGALNNIEEERDRDDNNGVNTLTELNKDTFQEVDSNNSTEILNKDIENNEDNSCDDDLFLPSGVVMKLNNGVTTLTELNKDTFQKVDSNNSTKNINKEIENKDDNASDDDLFLPSGVVMELNNNEKEIQKVINAHQIAIVNPENLSCEKRGSDVTHIDSETENIPAGETQHKGNTRSDDEDNDRPDADSNTNQTDIDKDNYEVNERQCENIGYSRESPTGTLLAINIANINDIQPVISNETVEKTIATDPTDNINREILFMNINIKRELIAENERGAENGCDIDNRVEIKNEPNDVLENEYNETKENEHVIKVEKEDYNNCSIV